MEELKDQRLPSEGDTTQQSSSGHRHASHDHDDELGDCELEVAPILV